MGPRGPFGYDCKARSILFQDRYTPGEFGFQHWRESTCKHLVAEYPPLRQAIERHEGSMKWFRHQLLSFQDRLENGFVSISPPSEIIRVDARLDEPLRRLRERCDGVIAENTSHKLTSRTVLAVANAVAQACGGTEAWEDCSGDMLRQLAAARIESGKLFIDIGELLLDGGEGPGLGICRHRSLLFKYLLDALDVCPSALVCGVVSWKNTPDLRLIVPAGYHMWNVVLINGQAFVCDTSARTPMLDDTRGLEPLDRRYRRLGGGAGLSLVGANLGSSEEESSEEESDMEEELDQQQEQPVTVEGFPVWIHDKGRQLLRECALVVQELTGSDLRAVFARQRTAGPGVVKVGRRLALAPLCTWKSCPQMCAGAQNYSWSSPRRESVRLSAPEYMHKVLMSGQALLSDAEVCLADSDLGYMQIHGYMQTLCKRLFPIYAHAYLHHYESLRDREWGGFLRGCFGHFVFVSRMFDLMRKEDLIPLEAVIEEIVCAQACSLDYEGGSPASAFRSVMEEIVDELP